jgi:ABC-type multidrug transport system ATPase subunit
MSDLVIETHSLHKQYGSTRAVDRLEMHVPRGSVYGFLGRNGAGKTTTIRLLAGLIQPTGGHARVLDLDPQTDRIPVLERTSFVIDKMLLPSMTGNDLVRFNRGFFPRWSDALAHKYADALEIPMKQKFRKLSGGNQTKLCLLLALSQGAELVVLDEPTAGLDPIVTDQLLRIIIDDFAGEGRTLLLSSHHLSEVERVADWIGIIDHGKLLVEAQLDDVRANFRRVRVVGENLRLPVGNEVFHARTVEGTTEYVLRASAESFTASLRNQGATVLDVSPMNLHEIFLEVVGKGEANVLMEVLA